MKTKIIPFDLETAKKIQDGKVEGRVVTIEGGAARIVCFDKKTDTRHPLVVLIHDLRDPDIESVGCYTTKGEVVGDEIYNLCIEFPEETPKHEFKPFDKVLVRDSDTDVWAIGLYSHHKENSITTLFPVVTAGGIAFRYCIPFEGNEHLVGTIDKPKEE